MIIVALDEDPALRMVGNLVASPDGPINEIDPATIRIGDPVRVVFQRVEGGVVRHMIYDPATKAIWFGTDNNTLGRAIVPPRTPVPQTP